MSWWCALSCFLLVACRTPQPHLERVRRSQPLLGTFVTITVYALDSSAGHAAISTAFEEFRRVDALMSIHRPESELSCLNERAFTGPIPVSPELFRVIAAAQDIARQTEGSFDITIRPLAELWGFIWREYRFPTQAELKKVLPSVNYRLVQLDAEAWTVRFLAPGVSLDLGGIAKGYAVDCAIETLRNSGISNAMVKAGGDLRVIGAPPGRAAWGIQLEDPRKKGRRFEIPLRDAALSTSGNYENFFEINGERYAHILDPRTGFPVQGIAACTVIAPTCMQADALATACFVWGPEKSLRRFGDRHPMRFTLTPGDTNKADWPVRQTESFARLTLSE